MSLEDQLVEARLGVASSLYRALRSKHEPTATHCLRVAVTCSAWSSALGLPVVERDALEVAALLHDVGKIGVPDAILTKLGALTPEERASINNHWIIGLELLRSCCASPAVIETVAAAATWYDGSRSMVGTPCEASPMGARMLAIVDAFDAMISDQAYRRAFSRERAFNELHRCAGTQFDPELVNKFAQAEEFDQSERGKSVARRWLAQRGSEAVRSVWRRCEAPVSPPPPADAHELFQRRLLDNIYDAVVFVDRELRIIRWNHGAERLTGISAASLEGRLWLPSLLDLEDERGERVRDEDCPVACTIRSGVQWLRRLAIRGRDGRKFSVDVHAVPVSGADRVTHGIALILHDVSNEISLEARCENLQERAFKDPLTQLANRAEFDRTHAEFVAAQRKTRLPYSLMICDIDHFKRVNDTHGHQAGDEAIRSFASLLRSACGRGDLAARYGGEEFVLLCADCDNGTAVRRAEQLRRTFGELVQPALNGGSLTASFGVTEIQPGDTAETMLRRADRALMTAKKAGRNCVVQLGVGSEPPEPSTAEVLPGTGNVIIERHLLSEAPLEICVQRLRAFVADQDAHVEWAQGDQVRLRIGNDSSWLMRHVSSRPPVLLMHLRLDDVRDQAHDLARHGLGSGPHEDSPDHHPTRQRQPPA